MPKISVAIDISDADIPSLPDLTVKNATTVDAVLAIGSATVMSITRTDRTHGDTNPDI